MKKYYLLAGLLFGMTTFTAQAQSYNINAGSLTFFKTGSDLLVTQNSSTDTYYGYYNTSSNILIYGTGTPTVNTISIQSADETVLTLSNVVIQTSTDTPLLLTGGGTRATFFLAPGPTNQLKTTALPVGDVYHPAILVRGNDTQKLTITGDGALVAEGGESSAGIGGDFYGAAGEIKIEGDVTVIATGGMGGAGIGGGEGQAGGTITILSNAVIIAKGGNGGINYYDDTMGGAAGIGGGGPSGWFSNIGGSGGTITISDNARVTAYAGEGMEAGEGAAAIGSGQDAITLGTVSIGVSNKVIAVSNGGRPAIDVSTLGGNGYVMLLNFYNEKAAGTTNTLYNQYLNVLANAVVPVAYQSLAFSVAQTNIYLVSCNGIYQAQEGSIYFPVPTTGLTTFSSVADTNVINYTLSTPVPVPYSWLAQHYPLESEGNYETLAKTLGVNGLTNWQSYVAGLAPTNAQSTFTASISFTNGTPYITWTPNLAERVYTVQGKTNLTASSWGTTNSASRFFKVNVDLP